MHRMLFKYFPSFTLFLLLFLIGISPNYAQNESFPKLDWVMEDIEDRLGKGDKLAIRDLASVWQQTPRNKDLKELAQRYLLLTSEEYDWTGDNLPQSLLELYYEKESTLVYSEFLHVYYLTPIEQRNSIVQLQDRQHLQYDPLVIKKSQQNIAYALKKKDHKILEATLFLLSGLEPSLSQPILKDLVLHPKFYKLKPTQTRQKLLLTIFKQLPDTLAVNLLFQLADKRKLSFSFCQQALAVISNHFLVAHNLSGLKEKWAQLFKQYKSNFSTLRKAGYSSSLNSQNIFFEEEVDYFAWVLGTTNTDSLFWIKENALEDLIASQHPKVLFYLAGLQFQAWRHGQPPIYLLELQRLTDVQVQVENKYGHLGRQYLDETAQVNFLVYWSQHYMDYEWQDMPTNNFTNVLKKSDLVDSYEKHFRRLNSSNDSIALEAFYLLTEGIPVEINELMKKYRPLLRTYNRILPPLEFNILENLSFLTAFCREQDFKYKPEGILLDHLHKLEEELSPIERYKLENTLIDGLDLDDLTSLEYWAATKAQNAQLNFSIGRLLDQLYSKYWTKIVEDDRQLRLYLLKSKVFRELSNFGVARLYHKRILDEKAMHHRLAEMELLERDELIQEAIKFWGEKEDATLHTEKKNVRDLLNDPESFNLEEVADLKKYAHRELVDYFFVLKSVRNRKALKKLQKYILQYASTDLVPELFKIPLYNWEENPSAAKVVVKILEEVYAYSYSKNATTSLKKWYELWESSKSDYLNWGKQLFELQLQELSTKEEISIKNINTITQSIYYQPAYRTICLEALKKVEKSRSIPQLAIEPLLSVKEELQYLAPIAFSYRELDNLAKTVLIDDPLKWLGFLSEQSQSFNIDQKGYLLNNLFRQEWLFQMTAGSALPEAYRKKMIEQLEAYLNESEYLTEFEEEATQLNILLLLHNNQPLVNKLMVLNEANLDLKVKKKWLDIIFARMEFEEIGQIFEHLPNLTDFDESTIMPLIHRDFGIPFFEIDETAFKLFQEQFSTATTKEIYEYYLGKFNVDYKHKNGKLDFKKIYAILNFDLVVPFVGQGGQYRDYYVYALIKVLELHYKTTLGFSPKLNEYQTFFQFNSFARVKAWKQFLIEKGHVKPFSVKPSFNEDF